MRNLIEKSIELVKPIANFSKYPLFGLQWTSKHFTLWILILFALIGVPILYQFGVIDIEAVNKLGRFLCFAIVALSLDLIWGYGGMLCLCQFLFFALGGYAMGMFLAHHGGPEGIIGANGWGKIPSCLFVVYPYGVGESASDAVVPWFWKPFWTLHSTFVLGLLIPGLVAAVIGYTVFRSRVKGVFFAVLTQAIVLAFWLVFSMNNMMLCGTNGLTRFDRIMVGSCEKIVVSEASDEGKTESGSELVSNALNGWVEQNPGTSLTKTGEEFVVTLDKSVHVWDSSEAIGLAQISDTGVISDVANISIKGYQLTDPSVKLGLYLTTVVLLIGAYLICHLLIKSQLGRILIAIRDNENRLRFSGYQPYAYKTLFFSISAMLAGLAGMLYAPQMRIFTPTNLLPAESILVVVWVAVGGRGTLSGAILGTLCISYGYDYLTSSSRDAWPFVLGALVIAVTRTQTGLIGIWHRWLSLPILQADSRKIRNSMTPRSDRNPSWSLGILVFSIANFLLAIAATYYCLRLAGPFGDGLMASGKSESVVLGLLVTCMSLGTFCLMPLSFWLAFKKQWARQVTIGVFVTLTYVVGLTICWLYFTNTFENGILAWLKNGSVNVAQTFRGIPWILTTLFWSGIGLLVLQISPSNIWAITEDVPENDDSPSVTLDSKLSDGNFQESQRPADDNRELLVVKNLLVEFDGFRALDVEDFSVDANALNVIIGPNGAGKTTLCDVITGKTRPSNGSVKFLGKELTNLSDVAIARLGIGRKFQTPTVFDSLTVYENMELALPNRQGVSKNVRFSSTKIEQNEINSVLKKTGLATQQDQLVESLSHGKRQWLEISMLMLTKPKLLLVDEPAAGLSDEETKVTAQLLLEIANSHSVIVIEHDMEFVRMLNSKVTVLIDGKIEAQGSLKEIQKNETVRKAYLGR